MDSARDVPAPTVAAARAGDPAALRRIADMLGPRVVGYARGQGVEDPDVVANETLYRVLRDLPAFGGSAAKLRSWAFTIAHNLIVDDHRRRARRPAISDLAEVVTLAAPVDVEVVVTERSELGRTLAAIHELAPDQRDVLLLRHVADLSLADTAAVLGKRTNAVKQLQHRATKALRRRLADAAVTPASTSTFTRVP